MLTKLNFFRRYFTKNKYVFFDCNDASLALAKDIAKQKQGIVIFLLDPLLVNNEEVKKIKAIGAHYLAHRMQSSSSINHILIKRFLRKAKTYLFFMLEHDMHNIHHIVLFLSMWKRKEFEKVKQHFELVLRVKKMQNYIVDKRMRDANVAYILFDDTELIASEIVKKFPPIDTLEINTQNATVEDTYEVLIVGYDNTTDAILKKLIEATQFVGTHFKATVMVNVEEERLEYLLEDYQELKNHYDIDFVDYEVDSGDICAWMNLHLDSLKQIIVTTKNEKERMFAVSDLYAGIHIRNRVNVPIIVVRDNEATAPKQKNVDLLIHYVGNDEEIFTENKVLRLDHLHQAKAIHQFYNQLKPFARRITWEQLSNIKKKSNIAASESLYAKLKLMGKTIEGIRKMSEIEFQLFLQEDPDRLRNLAIAEHLRWNATYFTSGWKTWHLSEIPKDSLHQNEYRNLHACLVDWNTLKDVEKHFDTPFQIYDYNNILTIRMLMLNSALSS